jgi:hypothetical protein
MKPVIKPKKETRGRKAIAPELKKVPVTIYLPKIEIDNLGGKKRLQDLFLQNIKNYSNAATTTTSATI